MNVDSEFTPEELQALKDIAKDRLAVSRVWGKVKTFSLSLGGVVAGYIFLWDNFWAWIKTHLGIN